MENHANYDNVDTVLLANYEHMDAVLYIKDPLMGPGGLFERMTPSRGRLRTGRRYDVPLRGGVACP